MVRETSDNVVIMLITLHKNDPSNEQSGGGECDVIPAEKRARIE